VQCDIIPDKRRFGTHPSMMRENILKISSLLKGKTEFYSKSYQDIFDLIAQTDILYLDPPYQGVCGEKDSRYFSGVKREEFINFLDKLNQKDIMFILSYDGRTGDKTFGHQLPEELNLTRFEVNAGKSTQATLLGKTQITFESLYLSKPLIQSIEI
jgi:DNA adenine methylase